MSNSSFAIIQTCERWVEVGRILSNTTDYSKDPDSLTKVDIIVLSVLLSFWAAIIVLLAFYWARKYIKTLIARVQKKRDEQR